MRMLSIGGPVDSKLTGDVTNTRKLAILALTYTRNDCKSSTIPSGTAEAPVEALVDEVGTWESPSVCTRN